MNLLASKLTDYFSRFASLSKEETSAIQESCNIRTFPKGTILLKEGQVSTECYFVLKGCVRQYYVVNGEEKTSGFFVEDQWVVSMLSFMQKVPADHWFSCLEETTLVIGSEEKENDLYKRFPGFESISRLVLEKVLAEQQAVQAAFIKDTPEQRYLRLLNENSLLLQRVPQYILAGYIGVKPESLSRIRKRIALRDE